MMARTRLLLPLFFAAFTTLSLVAQDAGVPEAKAPREGTLLEALPSGALAFAETAGLAELIASIKGSASYQTLLASEQFKAIQATEKFERFQDGVSLAEFVLRMDLWEAGEKLLGGRAGLALYPGKDSEKPDLVFLLRPDPKAWSKQRIWTDPLLGLAAKRVERKRFSWGLKVYQAKGEGESPAFFALHKHWVAFSNNPKLLEKTISLQIDDPKERTRRKLKKTEALASDAAFEKMAKRTGDDHLARILVDTKTISEATGGRLGLPEKMDNPLVSLVAGGILEMAAKSSVGTVTVDTDESGFVFEASFDGDPRKLGERFQVFFSDHPQSGTTALPEVPGLIGGFSIYRDIATWYKGRDELLVESALPGFDKFEAGVGNLLPGKDIGEDVLPLLGNNVTFVSALQSYGHLKGEPGVKLPAFAFIIDLDQAEEATDIFQLFFQTLLSVLNFEAGKQNRQPWLIDIKMHGEVKVTTARYLENPKGDDLPVVFNFLPASARVGNKYIVSSSLELCENLIDAVAKPESRKRLNQNLHFEVRFEALAAILAANTDQFEAQRVGEGRTVKQAKADVALFLTLLRGLDSFSISTSADEEGFKFRVRGNLNKAKAP
jgi:hypothetical protein